VEEVLQAGIDEVIIIVQEDDLADFKAFFNEQISIENYNKLPRHFQDYARRLLRSGGTSNSLRRRRRKASDTLCIAPGKPSAMSRFIMLAITFIAPTQIDRAHVLLDAYHQHGTKLVGLRRTAEDQIAAFGTVAGVWLESGQLLNINEFTEKPTIDYARSHLLVPGLLENEYLTLFGHTSSSRRSSSIWKSISRTMCASAASSS
jgi:UTP--glucose-1-phosphate uridylyltransferase